MDDKFNLDELRQIISSYDADDSDVSLEEILKVDIDKKAESDEIDLKESKEIDIDVVKPSVVSITDAFEAIKSDKSTVVDKFDVTIDDLAAKEYSEPDVIESDSNKEIEETKKSLEITAEIDHKRFFSTEEFESIKNKNTGNIKDSISSFAKGAEEEDDGEEEYFKSPELTEEIDDFEKPEEREDVLIDLKKMNSSAFFKAISTFILAVFSCLFFIAVQSGMSLPGIVMSSGSKLVLTIVFSISLVATIVNINTIWKGFLSLIKLRCTSETMIFMAFVFNTILDMIYLIGNRSFDGHFVSFDFIYVLLLTFNIIAKKLLVKNIYKNFLIASSDGQKMVVNRPENEEIANDIILETGNGGDILYATKSRFVTDFIHNSFKDFDNCNRPSKFYLFCVLAILVFGVITLIVNKDVLLMFAYLAGAFSVVTPLLVTYSYALSVFINSKKARRFGGAIVGSESAYALEDAQTLIADDSDVFNVALNGIRMYGHTEVDECIVYLNSLFTTVGGPLKKLFSDMLSDSITSLPRADEIYYHDTMGYSCLVHSKVLVVGNKVLMDHFNIDVDDSEFEIIYQQKSKNVLFVAYDGELMGVFLLTYSLSHGVSKAFSVFESDQISVSVAERDSNITQTLLHNSFKSSNKSLFTIMKFRTARNFFNKFELKVKTPSILLSNTGLKGIALAIHGCRSMLFAIKTNNVIKNISSVMAILLITFLLIFSEPSVALPLHVLVFQLLWSLPVLFVSLFSK